MIIKIRITTPRGQASKANKNLQPVLIGSKKRLVKFNSYVNAEDNELYWEIESDIKRCMKISKNVNGYKGMIELVLGSKRMKKMIKDEAQKKELESMLRDQTRIEVVKEAEAQELVDYNKTFWVRMKEKFKKNKEET